jgi:hypothetical protein
MKKRMVSFFLVVLSIVSTVSAQGFDASTEATAATTTIGTVFGIVFATLVSITIGWKVITYIRR